MYAGRAAGSFYNEDGGGANYLCLPEQPQYSTYTTGVQTGRAYLYGAEYQAGVPGTIADTNGVLFYHVEVKCNGIPCPP